jgi:hypothetical protein
MQVYEAHSIKIVLVAVLEKGGVQAGANNSDER